MENTEHNQAQLAKTILAEQVACAKQHGDLAKALVLGNVIRLLDAIMAEAPIAKMVPEWDNWKDDDGETHYGLGSVMVNYATWHMEEFADKDDDGADQLSEIATCMIQTMNIIDELTEPMEINETKSGE
jgi:hypothetical protein